MDGATGARTCDDSGVDVTAEPSLPPGAVPARTPRGALRRPERGRWCAGVASGVSAHLGLPLPAVRVGFVVLTLLGGVGVMLYGFWWLTVPAGDPWHAAADTRPSALSRVARRPAESGERASRRWPVTDIAVGLLLVAIAVLLAALRQDRLDAGWVLPMLVVLAGAALAWSQLDEVARGRLRSRAGGRTPLPVVRLLGGVVLAGVGVLLLVGQATGPGVDAATFAQSVVASLAVLAGVAVVVAPWWLRLWRALADERAARARESERADIAAHLHDSVLQTLALIRARADDPAEVARMARAQERELREWLYDDRPAPGTSLAAALRAVVAEVEDSRSGPGGEPVAVDAVVVGDRVPDEATAALLQATREALVNAVVHGRPPVSLYLEVGTAEVEVFVKDRGDGFDVDAIGADRFGVRESIMGRVRRRGGTATVTSRDGQGTEVHLSMPFAATPPVAAEPGEPVTEEER